MIFKPAPSVMVRAEIFSQALKEDGNEVSFYYEYSKTLQRFLELFLKFKLLYFIFFSFLEKIQKIIGRAKRLAILKTVSTVDAIIIIKFVEPSFISLIREKSSAKILYDFDDAVWLPSFLGEEKFNKIIQLVDFVSCDNNYLKARAKRFNEKTFVLNGPSQLELFEKSVRTQKSEGEPIVIGWIGSPSTLFYLYSIYDAMEEIGRRYPNVVLHLVGTGYQRGPEFEKLKVVRFSRYDQAGMVKHVNTFDIGLYPLFNNDLALGRGSLKATIYMAGKVPVAAAALGENCNLIQDGVSGLLSSNTDEWVKNLSLLIENKELRVKIAKAGYDFVREKLIIEKCYRQMKENFLIKLKD
jgi:glycosyltransferase involved in cell wall biosynthesis